MKKETLVLESSIVVPVKKRDTTLTVKLGWDAKSGTPKEKIKGVVEGMVLGISDNSYDLNLAAVVEYNGGKKPELVFHGQRSRADSGLSFPAGFGRHGRPNRRACPNRR